MLCDARGLFIYQVRPDLFPQGILTDEEVYLWNLFYTDKNKKNA